MHCKISFDESKTRFIQRDSVTVCTMVYTVKGLDDILIMLPWEKADKIYKTFKMAKSPFTVVGVARCHVDDGENYSLEKGKHIAETKAKAKAYNKLTRLMKVIAQELYDSYKDVLNLKSKFFIVEHQELKHLEELSK